MKTKTAKTKAAAMRQTLCGAEINPLPTDLPYETVSLCRSAAERSPPDCSRKTAKYTWRKPVPTTAPAAT